MISSSPRLHQLHQGYTLVEMLAGLVILVILVSLLLPAFRSILMHVSTAKCTGNLKQIHQGIMLYASENNGRLPRYREGRFDASGTWIRGQFWHTTIKPYMDNAKDDYLKCPVEKRNLDYHYGLNASISDKPLGGPGEKFQAVVLPSRRFLVADNNSVGGDGSRITMPAFHNEAAFRHPGTRCNILFLDGHVELLKLEDLPLSSNGFKTSDLEYKAFYLGQQ